MAAWSGFGSAGDGRVPAQHGCAAPCFSVVGSVTAQAPFNFEEDVAYTATLWERLARFNL